MNVKLLDCTLRDGGYVNNWNFGKENIGIVLRGLEESGIDIIEMGFLRADDYSESRTIFNCMNQVEEVIGIKKPGLSYSVMAESAHRINVDKLENASESIIDMVRIIIWKTQYDSKGKLCNALEQGYMYCKEFTDKGYNICVQPARVEQYTDYEFRNMLRMYSELKPTAIYVVDSWGTMFSKQVIHYMTIADDELADSIAIGFHGHNNQMQAFSTVEEILRRDWKHDLIIDSSIFGIGRCAGNLNTEIVARYLNEEYGKEYNLIPLYDSYERSIKSIYKKTPWGYSVPYMITACQHANPNYGNYYQKNGMNNLIEFNSILNDMDSRDKVLYTDKLADSYLGKME